MKFMNREEKIAWLAGLLEGEGYFRCVGICPQVRLETTDEDVSIKSAEIVFELTGKQLNVTLNDHCGRKGAKQDSFRWGVHGEHARIVMKLIIRFMSEHRKHQISAALQGKRLLKKVDLGGLTPLKPPKMETVLL